MSQITEGKVDLDNNRRICIHLNRKRPTLVFRYREVIGGDQLQSLGVENLKLDIDSPPNDVLKAVKDWLESCGQSSSFRQVWGTYSRLKSGL